MGRTFEIRPNKLPDIPAIMVRTTEALNQLGGSGSIQELDDKVQDLEGVTSKELEHRMNNDKRARFNYFCAWARTYLKRGDIVENSARGVWAIKSNTIASIAYEDAQEIYRQVLKEEAERNKIRVKKKQALEIDELGDDEDTWQERVLSEISAMSSDGFERLAQRLMREVGFIKVEVRGKSGDGGIDGVGVLRMNLITFQVYFQCKKWANSVGAKEIRDFRGALQGRADKGLFITTSSFSSGAVDEATRDGALGIDLIDGERLAQLLKDYGLGILVEQTEKVTVEKGFFASI